MNKAYSRKALDVLDICYGWVTRLTRSFPEDSVEKGNLVSYRSHSDHAIRPNQLLGRIIIKLASTGCLLFLVYLHKGGTIIALANGLGE